MADVKAEDSETGSGKYSPSLIGSLFNYNCERYKYKELAVVYRRGERAPRPEDLKRRLQAALDVAEQSISL
jgi:hypothetical protein